jgi:predicted GNAT family acetyltransferase
MPTEPRHASPELVDNAGGGRFEMNVDGEVAFLEYRRIGDRLHLMHTEVPSALRGRGAGGRLVAAVLDKARAEGVRVVPNCPFVKAFLGRHPEYRSLVHVPRARI